MIIIDFIRTKIKESETIHYYKKKGDPVLRE